jgi:tRNA (guanosine-2'-O-)-methyltransferase
MRPERFHRLRDALSRRQLDLTVLMERVSKSHNFSAILRNCDAVGALEAHVVPPAHGLAVHHTASAGTRRWIRVHRHTDVAGAVAALRGRGFQILAAHPSDEAVDFRDLDYTGPTAFMMGAELYGLSEDGLALATRHVVIPMMGMVQSLNVSVATAILLYEAQRQRVAKDMYRPRPVDDPTSRDTLFRWAYPALARRFDADGRPYPSLDEDGQILKD